ncbi:MAG: divalent-cation tolerance protein CutA [Gemmatimonadales bacterium]|nr:divalent-cation tolerance protein CutA [Gemmatimonadales bacterium]
MTSTSGLYCIVQTTVADAEQADLLARTIVNAKLGACVQVQAVRSYYTWEGTVRADEEQLLTIKTRRACYQALESLVRANHPYDVPEIIELPIAGGSAAYLGWIDDVTAG